MRSRALAATLAALSAAVLACAQRADPRLVTQPIGSRTWVSTLRRDHPLVGKIWDVRAGRFTDEAALASALSAADVVLLGEVHDNVDHHLLQARLVRGVLATGRRPALAFEMLGADQQPAVDGALARSPRDADALARAVAWNESGWPEFDLYRPIFQAGLDAGVPVIGANLPTHVVQALFSKGAQALDAPLRERLAREEPLPPPLLESIRAEMRDSHCGALPDRMLDPLVLAQRAKDAEMAMHLERAGSRGAILVAGAGHVRTDRGVPAYLRSGGAVKNAVAVAFLEVLKDGKDPQAYHGSDEGGPLPYDFAIFTPGQEREDPCEGIRHALEQRAKKRAAEKAGKPEGADAPSPPAPPDAPR
jgi:uncharacterized iron-regulated protein